MFELNLPKAAIKLGNQKGKPSIWDAVRKKWLQLTPEEYVRQYFLHYLTNDLSYPASLISIERSLEVIRLAKRFDIVVYNSDGKPHILVECKAPQVKISQETLEQASAYNLTLKAPYLAVTNGLEHFYFSIDFVKNSFSRLEALPNFG